jgi:pimeloyl-ACP methyl ester carboxylesterase
VSVLVIHRVNNFLGHLAAWRLVERGFIVLAMNSRFENNEASVIWEVIAQDVKTGVEYLRRQRGIRKVVLFGHSGGAATLSFYQAVAEQGTSFCSNPQKLTVCGPELANLPRADGLILVDASLGNPIGLLRGLNPAVKVEGDPASIDPSLDPFNPANGFDLKGSTYSDRFKQKYYAAQSARMNRLIAMAIDQVSKFGTAGAPFPDDNPFLIVRAAPSAKRGRGSTKTSRRISSITWRSGSPRDSDRCQHCQDCQTLNSRVAIRGVHAPNLVDDEAGGISP